MQVWDLAAVSIPSALEQAPPTPPHLTICTSFNQLPCWVAPGILATSNSHHPARLELWDTSECTVKSQQSHENARVYRSQRTFQCLAPPTSLSVSNGVIVVGESDGSIQLFDAKLKGGVEGCLQTFSDHKGSITDLYVVGEVTESGRGQKWGRGLKMGSKMNVRGGLEIESQQMVGGQKWVSGRGERWEKVSKKQVHRSVHILCYLNGAMTTFRTASELSPVPRISPSVFTVGTEPKVK